LRQGLERLGYLGERNPGRLTKKISITDGTKVRALHITAAGLGVGDEAEEEPEEGTA
jgi:hypothetical protein